MTVLHYRQYRCEVENRTAVRFWKFHDSSAVSVTTNVLSGNHNATSGGSCKKLHKDNIHGTAADNEIVVKVAFVKRKCSLFPRLLIY